MSIELTNCIATLNYSISNDANFLLKIIIEYIMR